MNISDFGPSLSVESWFCSDSCPPLVAWSLTQAPIPFQTFCYCINSPPCLSFLASTKPQSGSVHQLVARSVPDKDEQWASSCLCELSCSRMWTNSKLVNACNFGTSEAFTFEIILPCCLLLHFKQVLGMNWLNYTLTMNVCGLHLFVASYNFTIYMHLAQNTCLQIRVMSLLSHNSLVTQSR